MVTALRLLVLGINYAPEPTGIAPYTSGLCRGLHELGHDVRVITTMPHYPRWAVDPADRVWSRHDVIDGVSVTRVRHFVPSRPSGIRRALSELSFGLRVVARPWRTPDAVICVSPALLASAAAIVRLGPRRRARPAVGLVVQDLYSLGVLETGAGGRAVQRALARVESRAARAVDGISVIHERFRATVVNSLGVPAAKVVVNRNWTHVTAPPVFDRQAERRRLGWAGRTVVLHTGAMGEKQGLSNVVEAAELARQQGSDILFVLLGDGGQRRTLEQSAPDRSHVAFIDPLPSGQYERALAAADILLVNERPGLAEMAVPSKLTSYFSSGRPVLAATEPHSTTAEELATSGAGVRIAPGDPTGLVSAVSVLSQDSARADELGARGPDYCARVLSEVEAVRGYERWVRQLVERSGRTKEASSKRH